MADKVTFLPQGYELWQIAYDPEFLEQEPKAYLDPEDCRYTEGRGDIHISPVVGWEVVSGCTPEPFTPSDVVMEPRYAYRASRPEALLYAQDMLDAWHRRAVEAGQAGTSDAAQ